MTADIDSSRHHPAYPRIHAGQHVVVQGGSRRHVVAAIEDHRPADGVHEACAIARLTTGGWEFVWNLVPVDPPMLNAPSLERRQQLAADATRLASSPSPPSPGLAGTPPRRLAGQDMTILAWHIAQAALALRNRAGSIDNPDGPYNTRHGLSMAVSAVCDACERIDPSFDRRAFAVACDVPEAL